MSSDFSIWGDVISSAVSVACVFFSYRLGLSQSRRNLEIDQARARYNGFYVPFFTKLYAGRMWECKFSHLGAEARCVFLDLLTHNLSLLGPDLQALYPDFYLAFLRMADHDLDPASHPNAPKDLDAAFRAIEKAALRECRELSKSLRLISIARTYEMALRKARVRKPKRTRAGY